MFAQITYRSLVYPFFSAISILSFSLYPMISSAYPSLGSQCSSCHASTGEGQTGSTTETSNTTVEEEMAETINSTPDEAVEEDIIATTNNTTEQPLKENTNTSTTAEQPTTAGDSSGSTTTGKSTTQQTTGTHNSQATDLMTEFDINKDGQITQDEVQAIQNDSFKTADTDANAYLTKEEFLTGILSGKLNGYACQLNFVRLDNNVDQLISQDEFVNNVPLFDKLDLDNNGIVTTEELSLRNLYDYGMSYGKLHGMGKGHRGSMNQKGSKGPKHHSH